MRFSAGRWLTTALALIASACQPNAPFREQTTACTTSATDNGASCASHSLEEHRLADFPKQFFLLGFVEVDDQGKPYTRGQIDTLFNRIKEEARYKDLSIVVYVHGWKHNDTASDTNVQAFRGLLIHPSLAPGPRLLPSVRMAILRKLVCRVHRYRKATIVSM